MKKNIIIVLLFASILTFVSGCSATPTASNIKNISSDASTTSASLTSEEIAKQNEEKEKLELEAKIKARETLEVENKAKYGEFYVPLPSLDSDIEIKNIEAKGIYITGSVAGFNLDETLIEDYASYVTALQKNDNALKLKYEYTVAKANKLEKAIGLAKSTEVNAFVIDVKNDDGIMTYKSDIAITNTVGSNSRNSISDIDNLMTILNKYDIYTIARVVTFKDKLFATNQPQHAMQLKSGGVWKDNKGVAWVNQFDKYVWDYNIAIAKEAALKGFDEIQFDYVRFPDNAKTYNPIVEFPGRDGRDKDEAIEDFLAYARAELKPYGVHIAADVFGVITKSWDDKPEDIGQTWRKVALNTEYICPMIYPSHYGANWYGFAVPDAHPYGVLEGAMIESIERNAAQKNAAIIRPWIQGFTATWIKGYIKYTPEAIQDQILACQKYGINDYLIWSAGSNYDPQIFLYDNRRVTRTFAENEDLIGRKPAEVLEKYFNAEKNNRISALYLLTAIDSREIDYDDFEKKYLENNLNIVKYTIGTETKSADGYTVDVSYSYKELVKNEDGTSSEQILSKENEKWSIIKENNVWKVKK